MCPYYLDGDLAQHDPKVLQGPVIPVFSRRLSMAADVASVQFSRTVERRISVGWSPCARPLPFGDVCAQEPADGRSLKTQQHAGVVVGAADCLPK